MGEFTRADLVDQLAIWSRRSRRGDLTQLRLHLKKVREPLETWELDTNPMEAKDLVDEIERKVVKTAEVNEGVCYFELFASWGNSDRAQATYPFSLHAPGVEEHVPGTEDDAPNERGATRSVLRILNEREHEINTMIRDFRRETRLDLQDARKTIAELTSTVQQVTKAGIEVFTLKQRLLDEEHERRRKAKADARLDEFKSEAMEMLKTYVPIIVTNMGKPNLLGPGTPTDPASPGAANDGTGPTSPPEPKPAPPTGEHSAVTRFLLMLVMSDMKRANEVLLPALKFHQQTLAKYLALEISQGNLSPGIHAGVVTFLHTIDKRQYRAWRNALTEDEAKQFDEILKSVLPDDEEEDPPNTPRDAS